MPDSASVIEALEERRCPLHGCRLGMDYLEPWPVARSLFDSSDPMPRPSISVRRTPATDPDHCPRCNARFRLDRRTHRVFVASRGRGTTIVWPLATQETLAFILDRHRQHEEDERPRDCSDYRTLDGCCESCHEDVAYGFELIEVDDGRGHVCCAVARELERRMA